MSGQTPEVPAGIAVYPAAIVPNQLTQYGQQDKIAVPVIFPRYMTPAITQVQLSNGWDSTNMGKKDVAAAASYLAEVAAFQPGQTRMTGMMPANFPMTAMAPQTWNNYVQSTAGAQPVNTGGVGTTSGPVTNVVGSGA
jgi:hypothetical protein